jgi:glycosyltransferase involved in cell wall biosynthesis
VVIPCRNDHTPLAACLASLEEFICSGDPVVVVDAGGDGDEKASAMAHWPSAVYLHSPDSRRGYAIGRGITWLLNSASVDVLLICHADMRLQPGTRQKMLGGLGLQPRCQWGFLGHRIEDRRVRFRLLECGNNLRGALLHIPYGDQAMFAGTDLLARAGGFPLQPVMEDIELSLRLRQLKAAMWIHSPVMINNRHWSKGVCKATARNWLCAAHYISERRHRLRECLG